ncbi:hypothetical protein KL911_002392 [Ogataea haglerorum]|uniref:uncharacterized protein n=1 Tax=Ogataea haglerorum TaxID=1937702 RepID=UPI001C89C37A|nr:uncharacterized protein KL911_002392 [Ogataea haglerorum]KAG7753916.1 hypothetical protein KL911_002392 [Ogataea haglerorum]
MTLPCPPFKAKAIWSWGGNNKDKDLGFIEGDIIEVSKTSSDGQWCYGVSLRTKLTGRFPTKFIQVLQIKESGSRKSLLELKESSSSKSLRLTPSASSSSLKLGSFVSVPTDVTNYDEVPPPPPKHQYSTYNKLFTSSYTQRILDSSTLSTDTERSSYFGHSDFSATSAGSLMRHKESKMQASTSDSDRHDLVSSMLEKGPTAKHPNFFRRFLGRRSVEPSLDDQIFSTSLDKLEELTIIETNTDDDLARTQTLSGRDRANRKSRVVQEEPDLILQPQKAISSLNVDEKLSYSTPSMIDATDLDHVDEFVAELPDDRFIGPREIVKNRIVPKLPTSLERLRAIYIYLTTRFEIIGKQEKLSAKVSPSETVFTDIIHRKRCTGHELTWMFYIMASHLDLEMEIILGNFKRPLQPLDSNLVLNHTWISVLVEGEYRFIDVALGNHTNPINDELNLIEPLSLQQNSEFYFLTKPLDLLYTHVPMHADQQHIVPPLDPLVQMALPPLYSGFLYYKLSLYKFNHSLFRLKDLELIEFDLEIPRKIDVRAIVRSYDNDAQGEALVQIYMKRDKRLAKIKAAMPPRCSLGFICVYARSTSRPGADFSMVLSLPCSHKGKYKPIEWVKKNDNNAHLDFDLYIKQPQIFNLTQNSPYTFQVFSTDSTIKCNLISPTGTFHLLQYQNDAFELTKRLNEPGLWRLVVLNNDSWHVYAEWSCS